VRLESVARVKVHISRYHRTALARDPTAARAAYGTTWGASR
jgi:hypothetical protein